ncbi:hypothetical protein AURDEDRAFT_174932 [Auricularia subglabra TFB-10046 SS5]|uniref:HNH nuclease domain-containing protein n=1 Tax=Auricularia subglabra (strain TFB-10046 / SS5) TaxID=717982 RepID=J0LFG1_AURST|nr:hypothetical protein AURDEDRAFT_174932 [Auricularia subglabra TFB-10046 SS5]
MTSEDCTGDCVLFTIPYSADLGLPSVVLKVPLDELKELALRPVRWMKLVAWGILGCEGDVQDAQHVTLDIALDFDNLEPGEYTFVPAEDATFSFLNLDHTHTPAKSQPSQKSAAYKCPDPAPAGWNAVLDGRDGDHCVFSGLVRPQRAHVLPQRFSHNTVALQGLSQQRGFALSHHLDPQNTISICHPFTMIGIVAEALSSRYVLRFPPQHVLTSDAIAMQTEDRFLRNGDIPPPSGDLHGTSTWWARPEPQGETTTYVWQVIARRQDEEGFARLFVRANERARFQNPGSPALPSPAAVNYVYAAGMVREYLQGDKPKLLALLSRPEPRIPAPDMEEMDDAGSRDAFEDMDAFEFLFRLTHKGQFLDYYENEQRLAEEDKARRLREWRMSLPESHRENM